MDLLTKPLLINLSTPITHNNPAETIKEQQYIYLTTLLLLKNLSANKNVNPKNKTP